MQICYRKLIGEVPSESTPMGSTGSRAEQRGELNPAAAATEAPADLTVPQGAPEWPSVSSPTEAWGLGFYTQPLLIQLSIGCKLQGAVGSEVRGTWPWVRLRFGGGEFPDSSSPKSLPGSACQLGDESSDLKLGPGDTPHVACSSQKRK